MCDRDPEKIEELLNRLRIVWNKVPLGELVGTLLSIWGRDVGVVDEEDLITNLEDFYSE